MVMLLSVAVQPLASVTVTLYVPAASEVISCVVAPLLHKYVYGDVPPLTVKLIEPVDAPLQSTLTCVWLNEIAVGSVIVMLLSVAVQPLASVTVTLYVPAASEEIFC